ncbi:MAG: 16S rRNA (uracil(1498)-N(3))-methyltransferase [Dehalococcoidia bacterium]|nr:16S rRNA (uracil(1498)-N(3))-methyltransferase [Dehalococcoidia bacterium]MYD29182.1 16S rRNA (uracil(1498)-N(3))-methyltransferase [Dehalococcoidia bacterium]
MEALPRVCVPEGVGPGALELAGAQARHLSGSRRLRKGDEFLAFAGDGVEYRARIEDVSRERVRAAVGDVTRRESRPARSVEVWCANVRANRMEWAIEKCVEAGVDVFRPITTEHSVRGQELSESRRERWERIAIEAAEQCGRLYLPVIAPVVAFREVLADRDGALVVANRGGTPWSEVAEQIPEQGAITIAIGPEGGFTEDEVEQAIEVGAIVASLGKNTLRTETAAVVTVALARA